MTYAPLLSALALAGCLPYTPDIADSGVEVETGVEDTACALSWYPDTDADGHGDASAPITACEAPGGYVGDGLDCDDEDVEIHPGASERCDGVDNDCDGLVDDEDDVVEDAAATTVYPDADSDGYGDPDGSRAACELPDGWVSDASDCDDGDPATYPGATEICQDGSVNDCDMDEATAWTYCELASGVLLSEADAEFLGTSSYAYAGISVDSAGDTNGDGHADLLVGAPALSCASTRDWGTAYLVLGPVTGEHDLGDVDAVMAGEDDCDEAGDAVRGVGDLDGDGFDDVLVGAPSWDKSRTDYNAGAAYVVLGPVSGSFGLEEADARLAGADVGDQAGDGVSTAGDLDGDGALDLLVGASAEGTAADESGAAYLVLGPVTASLDLSVADAALYAVEKWDKAGNAVAGGGDVDADGHDDLLVGAYDAGSGTAYLQLGPVSGSHSLADADAVFEGESGGSKLGISLAFVGDADGDGKDDVLVGAPGAVGDVGTAGAGYLLLGPVTSVISLEEADAKIVGMDGSSDAGSGVAGPGDMDGDGLDDLLIGAPGDPVGEAEAGGPGSCSDLSPGPAPSPRPPSDCWARWPATRRVTPSRARVT